ncbi:MAG: hypothetical protein AB7Q81_07045 [Gammaproteobacteria bacterium]
MSDYLERALALHFHPRRGSPYWLERAAELGFDPRARIATMADLDLLGPFDLEVLGMRPYTDFVPRDIVAGTPLVLAETGGTTGAPRLTAYTEDEFEAAFVTPFFECVNGAATFNGGHWLWLGPSGPHVIGKAAQRIARLSTGRDALSVDFDPRWFRRLAAGSLARERYLEHVIEQALRLVQGQDVRYLFTTPVVLERLLVRMVVREREAVRFVYLGGMAIDAETLATLATALPGADFLCGYGNTLFGVCHEARAMRPAAGPRHYYPHGERIAVRIVQPGTTTPAAPGERGQVAMTRCDLSMLLPGVLERDHALASEAPDLPGRGAGLADPRPPATQSVHIDNGIY